MQKTAVSIIIAIVLSLLLLGCRQEEEVGTVTAVAVATTPPTVTSSPMVVVVETAVPTATQTPEPTPTPTSISSYPTLQPPSSIPVTNLDVNYALATPSADRLLQVMEQAAHTENMFREQYTSWTVSQFLYPLLFADTSQISVNEFPDIMNTLTDASLVVAPSHIVNWTPSNAHFHFLKAAVLQYLNQNIVTLISGEKIEEEAALFLPIKLEDISNNGNSIWLVHVESRNFRINLFLAFEQNAQGNFTLIGEPLLSYSLFSFPDNWLNNIYTEYDVTGDGINEIIIESGVYYSGTGTETVFDVFSWHNGEFIKLENIRVFQMNAFEIADQNNDGIDDIQTKVNHYRNFGCAWTEVDTYSWPNQMPQHDDQNRTQPNTAVCNLWQAIYPHHSAAHPNKDDNYPILARAVSQLQENEGTPSGFLAYALSQLAFAYLEQGLDEQARQTIDQIYALPNQSLYGQYLQQHDTTGSTLDLCRNLNANAHQALETEMGEFLNEAATKGRGRDARDPDKAFICDLGYIALNQLQNTKLISSSTPTNALTELNFQFAFANSANLDNDPELEWIGILEPEAPWLVIFDDVDGVWDIKFVDDLLYSVLAFELGQEDLTNDGQLDTLIASSTEPPYGDTTHTVTWIDYSDEEFKILDRNSDFEKLPDLSTIDVTFFDLNQPKPEHLVQPDWKTIDRFETDTTTIKSYIEELTDTVLTQTDPDITSKITDLLNYLPSNDPEAQPYREHLTYLLGYHYELSGAEEEAVETYLNLIQQNPSSPWSWLAWARLEPE